MRYALLFATIVLAIGCGKGPDIPGTVAVTTPQKPIEGLTRYSLGSPITQGNVTIVPVTLASDQSRASDNYMSLEEAKKNGWVEISEMPQGKEVNRLFVRNLGKRPLMLLAGELLLGGDQDRVVAKDTVVGPGEETPVPVFCVEHGRWTGASDKFEFSDSMVPQSVRGKVNFGSQEDVWNGVGEYNKSAGTREDTTSVRGGLFDANVQKRIDANLKRFSDALDGQKNVVGLVYLVDGDIGSFELFGSESLFNASREPLLRGFLADSAVRPSRSAKPVDLDAIAKFVKDSLTGSRSEREIGRGQASWSVSNDMGGAGIESTLPDAATPKDHESQEATKLLHGSYSPHK